MDRGIITISETGVVTIPTAPVWMTKFEIADLFGVFAYDIRKSIRQIYRNGELQEDETMKYIRQGENVNSDVYSLEMVVAIAFRTRGKATTTFRKFVLERLYARQRDNGNIFLSVSYGNLIRQGKHSGFN